LSIQDEARSIEKDIISWRRAIHANPELGLETPETEKFIADTLAEIGVEDIKTGVGGHGVVAYIEGKTVGKTLALRADCDALPVKEETGLSFAATNGNMHACGHDAHTAMLLGAAKLLWKHRDELKGKVQLIFQPAEEQVTGAKAMLDDGLFDRVKPDVILGMHTGLIFGGPDYGQIGYRNGAMMASVDRFVVTLKGKGSHGAYPHSGVDPVSMVGQVLVKLQTILSREKDPLDPAVITVGKIQGGTAFNIIPGECTLEGTVRTLNPEVRAFIEKRIREIVSSVSESMRGTAEVKYFPGPPSLINDSTVNEKAVEIAKNLFGEDGVAEVKSPVLGGEDFAYYLEHVPGAFLYHAGSNPEKGQTYPHHNSRFDIDEDSLWKGTALFTAFALQWQD
jgi:amidohydrolase